MPGFRSKKTSGYSRRRTFGRKKVSWYNRKYTPMQVAKAAWRGVWKLKGLVNSEMHKLDSNSGSVQAVNTGVVDNLCKVAVGDTYTDRTGNSIFARSLNIKGFLALPSGETQSIVRMAVVQDTQQIGDTNPTFGNIYDSTSVNCHLNPETVGRFKVLRDMKFVLDSDNNIKNFELNLPMRHHIRYNGINNTDIQKGAIYMVYIGGAYTTTPPTLNYNARLSFHDN